MKKIIILALLFGLTAEAAYAGPLQDLLAEHKAARQDDEFSLADEADGNIVLPRGVRVLKDVSYGNESEQRMDIYLPARAEQAPMIVMVHGGAWRYGDKGVSSVVQNKVTRWVARGFIFISVNYRLLPKAPPLLQAEDVAKALTAIQTKASAWGGDPHNLILMGHSAGAHLVALLAAAPEKAQPFGVHSWLGTVLLDSAAMDIVQVMKSKHYRFYDHAFGKDEALWQAASPFHVLSVSARPMLLVCSSVRADKPCEQARAFAVKAAAQNTRVEISEQTMSHKKINQTLGLPGSYTDAVETFMASLDVSVLKKLADR